MMIISTINSKVVFLEARLLQYNIYDVAMYTFVDLLVLAFKAEEDSSLDASGKGRMQPCN